MAAKASRRFDNISYAHWGDPFANPIRQYQTWPPPGSKEDIQPLRYIRKLPKKPEPEPEPEPKPEEKKEEAPEQPEEKQEEKQEEIGDKEGEEKPEEPAAENAAPEGERNLSRRSPKSY